MHKLDDILLNMKQLVFLTLAAFCCSAGLAQTVIPLYKDPIPNSKPNTVQERSVTDDKGITRIHSVTIPTLTVFQPEKEKANGTAVIICPGGGYRYLAFNHEGTDVARRFVEMGVTAFVLKYRLPNDSIMLNKEIGPVMDAQRAIQLVRERAKEFGIKKDRVGIMGFSAGGHLASTAGTHFNKHYLPGKKKGNLRPDFMILVYPVISFADSIAHMGSRNQLLGNNPSAEKVNEYSNELHINKKTPPTFLVHAEDDKTVKVQNMLHFATALQHSKVPFDFYLYEQGGHGFGMFNTTSDVKWMDLVERWIENFEY
jgi:acetyl esterase/lipase